MKSELKAFRVTLLTEEERDRKLALEDGRIPILVSSLSKNQCVGFYLMASYLYYQLDKSLLEDSEYDRLCQRLDREWNRIKHQHKYLIDRDALAATTGYQIKDYPLMVMHSAIRLYEIRNGNKHEATNVRNRKLPVIQREADIPIPRQRSLFSSGR